MNLKNIAKRFAVSFAEEFSVDLVRGYIGEKLKPCTPDDLAGAVEGWYPLWNTVENKEKKLGRTIGAKFKDQIFDSKKGVDWFNASTTLSWLQADRADLASLIINWPKDHEGKNKAYDWLVWQMTEAKRDIFGLDENQTSV